MRSSLFLITVLVISCRERQEKSNVQQPRSTEYYKAKKTLTSADSKDIITEEYKLSLTGLALLRSQDTLAKRKAWETNDKIQEWEEIRRRQGADSIHRDQLTEFDSIIAFRKSFVDSIKKIFDIEY